jgi:hypothetical protein
MLVPLTVCFHFPDPIRTVSVYVYVVRGNARASARVVLREAINLACQPARLPLATYTHCSLVVLVILPLSLCLFLVLALLCFFMCLGCFAVSFLEFNFLVSLFCADYYCSVIKVRKITGNFHSCFHQGKPRIQCAKQVNTMWNGMHYYYYFI